jgi:hypothetical protein
MTLLKTLLGGLSLVSWMSFLATAQETPVASLASNASTRWTERNFWETTDGKQANLFFGLRGMD